MNLHKTSPLLLSVIAALLLWLAWPPSFAFPLIFVAFIPFFLIERQLSNSSKKNTGWKFFGYVFLGLLIWNLLTTFWIWYATATVNAYWASIAAWVTNALLMSLPWVGFYRIKKRYNLRMAFFAFIAFWLCFEFVHFSWELAWPWLTLGNVFAKFPQLIQWYEITGVSGGTLWILIVNILLYKLLFLKINQRKLNQAWLAILLIVPTLFSIIRYSTYKEKGDSIKVNVIQPNVDPYAVLEDMVDIKMMLSNFEALATEKSDSTTDYIVFPEGAFLTYPWWRNIDNDLSVQTMNHILDNAPNAKIVVGSDLLVHYGKEQKTPTARFSERGDFYYDVYNAAFQIEKGKDIQFHGKSKLVPGVERIPYPQVTNFLKDMAIQLHGAAGSRATQKNRVTFEGEKATVAPAICYESVFGDYVNEFVKNGADVIFIITNDGWWKDTPGYKQHMHYARLRAVENRRSVARSANTGISAFINQRGDVLQQTDWWMADSIVEQIHTNQKITFYSKYGDVIYRVGALMTVIFILISLVKRWTNGFKYRS